VANDTILQNGALHVDLDATAKDVNFVRGNGQKLTDAMLVIDDNPLAFKGTISGLEVGDKILFQTVNDLKFIVTDATVTKDNHLIITYNNSQGTGLHTSYDLKAMQPQTELHLTHPNAATSELDVVKTVGVAASHSDVQHGPGN
jgi:hypothetical protein